MRPVKGNPRDLKRSELQKIILERRKELHFRSEEEELMKQLRDANLNEMVHGNADDWAEKVGGEINLINSATQAKSKPDSKSKKPKSKSKKPKPKNKAVELTKPMTLKEVKQVEEVIGEEAKTVVENALEVEADLKTTKSKESIKSIDVNYCIGNHCGGVLYEGTTSSRIFSVQRSFIEARSSQVDNIAELIDIGSNSRFIVTIDHLIDGPGLLPMLVAEPVMSVTSFFKVESDSFLSENNLDDGSRQRWWTHISESFRCIFGNIVPGIIYLHSLGHICGDVTNHIYVSAKGEGKILPLMDKSRSENYDIKNLIKKMKEIITLPFLETEVQEAYKLPDELTHLLGFVTADKLREIPLYWLVNHPYFWSSQERIKFLKDLKSLIKQDVITDREINHLLITYSSFKSQDPESIDWRKMIDDSVCDGFFKHIYDRPKSLEDVKEYDSKHSCEIVRYGTNCSQQLGHTTSYHIRIQGEKKMGIEEIEKSCDTSVAKEKIFVHAMNGDAGGFIFSEYTIDLRNGQVSECPYALLADSCFNTMVSLGSVIYVVGNIRRDLISCKTKPHHSICTKKGLYHKCMYYLDLANDTGDGWKEAPCLSNSPSPFPVALAFGGKIYVFHYKTESETANVFNPVSNKWESLLPPPGVPFFDTYYDASAVADSQNNRILVHFESIQSVFAYYPANNQWELVLKPFIWSSKVVFVDGVIFVYLPKYPELVDAYHVATKQWLNIVFTSKLHMPVWKSKYNAMFHLGSNLMCLAAHSSTPQTHVILTKFRFELSPHNPADLLITPLPKETYTIGGCALVSRFSPF